METKQTTGPNHDSWGNIKTDHMVIYLTKQFITKSAPIMFQILKHTELMTKKASQGNASAQFNQLPASSLYTVHEA